MPRAAKAPRGACARCGYEEMAYGSCCAACGYDPREIPPSFDPEVPAMYAGPWGPRDDQRDFRDAWQ